MLGGLGVDVEECIEGGVGVVERKRVRVGVEEWERGRLGVVESIDIGVGECMLLGIIDCMD